MQKSDFLYSPEVKRGNFVPGNFPKENKEQLSYTQSHALKRTEINESTPNAHSDYLSPADDDSQKSSILSRVNWNEFCHLFIIWIVNAGIFFVVILGLTMFKNANNPSEDLFITSVSQTDMLSLLFSLVVSAELDQAWNTEKSGIQHKLVFFAEFFLSFLGMVLYLIFSALHIFIPENTPYQSNQFCVNLSYLIAVVLTVIFGFLVRSYNSVEDK